MTAPSLQDRMFDQLRDQRLLDQARVCAGEYLDDSLRRPVAPSAQARAGLQAFREALPEEPASGEDILKLLHGFGAPATLASTGGRYFGFVNGGVLPAALAAKWLADTWDQNAALAIMSPIAAELETVCESWLVDLLQLPAGTAAGFVTGTSTATLCGLATGRNVLLKRLSWDADADGLFGAPPLRVVLGAQAHASVGKALGVLGLGKARVELAPADAQGRMIPEHMPALDDHCLVLAQAGNVNSGAFDDLARIGALAQNAGAWLHVDGAFGLWAAGSARHRHLMRGAELADSWSADAHKTLNAPYDCGIILCRRREALTEALQASASYLLGSGQRDGMHLTLDMSRRARAIELWATLKALGRRGVEDLVDRLCSHAQRFAAGLAAQGFRVLNEVVFNQVLVACATAEATQATLARIQQSGECWCGSAVWNGEPVIRISVCSWASTEDDIDRSVQAFVAARGER
ncbi:MAG: aminotransferase class V-fold PLP-dependent enzyme [Burkholderiaceae bacterium]|nr:aminotransferase class V-fold PLP-dependent enzyme [Burkholderiaceae bacterium]